MGKRGSYRDDASAKANFWIETTPKIGRMFTPDSVTRSQAYTTFLDKEVKVIKENPIAKQGLITSQSRVLFLN